MRGISIQPDMSRSIGTVRKIDPHGLQAPDIEQSACSRSITIFEAVLQFCSPVRHPIDRGPILPDCEIAAMRVLITDFC